MRSASSAPRSSSTMATTSRRGGRFMAATFLKRAQIPPATIHNAGGSAGIPCCCARVVTPRDFIQAAHDSG